MITLSKRMETLKPSPTLTLNSIAQELKLEGVDVVNLTLGEPDFSPPTWIQESVTQGMKDGYTKYTAVDGILALRIAIQQKFKEEYGLEYPLDMITTGSGTKQLIFNAMMATLNPDDEVIIPAPYWVSYPDIVKFCGAIPVFAEGNPCNHFKLKPEELEFRITDQTKWLILNSPNNPTGAVYSKEELFAIGQVLMKYPHVHILCDDIYEYLTFDDNHFYNLAKVEPRLYYRTLICNGVSKSFAMTGFRLGYAAGPSHIIKSMNLLQSQSTSNPCSLSQVAALSALTESKEFFKEWKNIYNERRLFVHKAINEITGLSCALPEGAFYVYVDCHPLINKCTTDGITIEHDDDLCAYLLKRAHVAVVPGSAFGVSSYFRISYATSLDTLKKGMEKLKAGIDLLRDP